MQSNAGTRDFYDTLKENYKERHYAIELFERWCTYTSLTYVKQLRYKDNKINIEPIRFMISF